MRRFRARRQGSADLHLGHSGKVKFSIDNSPGPHYAKIMTSNMNFVVGAWAIREGEMEGTPLYTLQNRGKSFEIL